MSVYKAPGSTGFGPKFFQWSIIKGLKVITALPGQSTCQNCVFRVKMGREMSLLLFISKGEKQVICPTFIIVFIALSFYAPLKNDLLVHIT